MTVFTITTTQGTTETLCQRHAERRGLADVQRMERTEGECSTCAARKAHEEALKAQGPAGELAAAIFPEKD